MAKVLIDRLVRLLWATLGNKQLRNKVPTRTRKQEDQRQAEWKPAAQRQAARNQTAERRRDFVLNKQQNDKKQSSPHTVVRREYCSSIL